MSAKKSPDISTIYSRLIADGGTVFPEPVVKSLLAARGIPVPEGRVHESADSASAYAKKLGWPVVLKIVSGRILHKTEAGGVAIGIDSEKKLRDEFARMARAGKSMKDSGYAGILVEKQCEPGVEIIAGLQNDAHFGPVLMIGAGGIFTDLLKDVAFRLLPVTKKDVAGMLEQLKVRPLLEGFRGAKKCDMKGLISAIHGIASFGAENANLIESADFNPIIVRPDGVTIVDAKIVLSGSSGSKPFDFEEPRTHHMEAFFNPKSVAVIGASAGEGKIGNVIVDSLVNYEYKGKIFPINPNRKEIFGVKCWPSIESLPETPELVVVVVDLGRVPELLKTLSAAGVHNVLIVAGGGKELGGEREGVEKEIVSLARKLDIRIIGPNCIGAFDGYSRFDSFFHHHNRMFRPPAGPLGFITQSGTWGCSFIESAEVVGVSKMVSYGNRVDVDEGDLIAYLAKDAKTKVIGSYIEGLGQGRKFLSAAKTAADKHGKPVVVFKTGRNPRSAKAAMSHTGAYGGSYHIYEGVLKQSGIVTVDSFHELYAACKTLALQPAAGGPRAAMLSNGAGPMVNALDLFPSKGLELVKLARSSVKSMRDKFSFFYLVENPVDVTGSASAEDYEFVIRTLLADPNVDIIMPFFVFQDTPLDESIIERLKSINKTSKKPIIGCAAGGPYTVRMSKELESIGIPVLPDVVQWVAAASASAQWGAIKKK